MSPVTEPDEIAEVARAIAKSPLAAFDLEFVSQDRLVPILSLLQVAWLDDLDASTDAIVAAVPQIRLIDPMVGDAGPVVRALATHPLVVAHAPRQDLALLATKFSTSMVGLVDTQLMAAFCGLGDQVGLAALAHELVGVALDKEQQWTAWERRPLSDAQLAYAAADVRYLPAIYAKLAARLGPRLAWARAETLQVVADALAAVAVTPETAWQNVGGARGLDAAGQAAVVELAAWRQRAAIELDRPLGQVLAEKLLVELARHRPANAGAVRALKGLSPLARTRADEIVAAIAAAKPVAAAGRRPVAARRARARSAGVRCCSRSCTALPTRRASRRGCSRRAARPRSSRVPSTIAASTRSPRTPRCRAGGTTCSAGCGTAGSRARSRSSATRRARKAFASFRGSSAVRRREREHHRGDAA